MSERETKRAGRDGWCCSGRHFWLSRDDAEKCCHPKWVRASMKVRGGVAYHAPHWIAKEALGE